MRRAHAAAWVLGTMFVALAATGARWREIVAAPWTTSDYAELAQGLSERGELGFALEEAPSARRAPFYPSSLALARRHLPGGMPGAQALAAGGVVAMSGLLASTLFSPLAGLAASVAVALHPGLAAAARGDGIEVFFSLMILVAAWGISQWLERPSAPSALAAGFLVSASLCTRGVLFLFPPVLAAWLWPRRRGAGPPRTQVLLFLAASYAFLLPWVARNAHHFREFIPFERSLAADTLAAAAESRVEFPQKADYIVGLEREWGCAEAPDRAACMIARARERIRAHPGEYLLSCARRLLHGVRTVLPTALPAALAVAMAPSRLPVLATGLLSLYFLAIYSPFASVERFFLPLIPCLLALAGGLIRALGSSPRVGGALRSPRPETAPVAARAAIITLVACLYAVMLADLGWEVLLRAAPCRLPATALSLWRCGESLEGERGQGAGAASLSAAVSLHPEDGPLAARLRLDLWLSRWPEGAPEDLARTARRDPGAVRAAALRLQDAGREQPSRVLLDAVLAAHPNRVDALIDRGIQHALSGRRRASAVDFRRAARLAPDDARAAYHEALSRELAGDRDGARNAYLRVETMTAPPGEPLSSESWRYRDMARAARLRLSAHPARPHT